MDILDEILLLQARQSSSSALAHQENAQQQSQQQQHLHEQLLHHQLQQQQHHYHQCHQYMGSCGNSPQAGFAQKIVVPSPRGIQDAFFDFMSEETTTSPTAAPQLYESSAFIEPVKAKPQSSHVPQPTTTTPTPSQLQHVIADIETPTFPEIEPQAFAPSNLTIKPPQFTTESITPWVEDAASSDRGNDESASATMRYYDEDDQDGSGSNQLFEKRNKAPSSRVMPPTAKSILERRERALREGRRNEARLNDEERRILRRLRNRESAERCSRRKNAQAKLMSEKIDHLESENSQLRSLAQEYQDQISKLEKVLWQRKAAHGTP